MAEFLSGNGGESPVKTRLMAEINITPMVDVMLVLLVIFMVTAPLLVAGVHVDLPSSSAPQISRLQKPVIVTLADDGALYVGDDRLDAGTLLSRLSGLKAQNSESVVYVRASRNIAYGSVLELLGHIGQAGFQHISLVSEAKEARSGSAVVVQASEAR